MSGATLDVTDGVARVTIDRPEVLNAVDGATHRELTAIWERLERERGVRAIVLTGAGERAFSVGADMKDAEDEGVDGLEYWERRDPNGFGGIALRSTLNVPLIARVGGYALGGGLEMALGCDLLVAAEDAQLGFPEPRVGRMPIDGGIHLLARRVGYAPAMELLLTGRRIGAVEAARIGLVNRAVPREELDAAVDGLVEEILECSPAALRAIKDAVRGAAHLPLAEAQAYRSDAVVEALTSPDAEEGVRAFAERRAPRWSDA
jgi:crotonobetainyl-CoA hydratase